MDSLGHQASSRLAWATLEKKIYLKENPSNKESGCGDKEKMRGRWG